MIVLVKKKTVFSGGGRRRVCECVCRIVMLPNASLRKPPPAS